MRLQRFTIGELMVNTYLFWDEGSREAIVIDPGRPINQFVSVIHKENLNLVGIILTHGHYDHIMGVSELKSMTGAPVYIHSGDSAMLGNPLLNLSHLFDQEIVLKPDRILADGEAICLGSSMLTVRHTPGHSPGCICLLGEGLMFSGDTLFAGSIGRTDLPGGDQERIIYHVRSFLSLSDNTKVFPGHGPETTIGRERVMNPFMTEHRRER